MKKLYFIFLLISSLTFGQKPEIEEFITQVANDEISESFNYYFVVSESLDQPTIYDSIQNYHIKEFRTTDKEIIENLYYHKTEQEIKIDWKNYNLKRAKFVINKSNHPTTMPPMIKNAVFVKYNISDEKFDRVFKNKKPHTLIVKKKWFWNKRRMWKNPKFYEELKIAWEKDEKESLEEKVYFQFSKPIFSSNGKYARVSLFRNRRCDGLGYTVIYKKDDENWRKLLEYNYNRIKTITSHVRCGEMLVTYSE